MNKDFDSWNALKKKLDAGTSRPPLVSESELWWVSIGENVGREIHGKSELYSRPVIILKKLAHEFYFVIPTTSKPRNGSWYASFAYKKTDMTACLHQARAMDYRRLSNRIGQLEENDFDRIKGAFIALVG